MEFANVDPNKLHRFFVECRCFRNARRIIDANFSMAFDTSEFRCENSHGFYECPRGDRQCEESNAGD